MEGEKERRREEKESNEAEGDQQDEARSDEAALVWQTDCSEDNLGLPIMHWEALSLRIAELEKQEEEKKAKSRVSVEQSRQTLSWTEERRRRVESWEEGDDVCNSNLMALTSRLQTQMNLQLCFINNSESEEEEGEKEEEMKKESCSPRVCMNPAVKPDKPKSRGFRNTLRNLRDRLKTDHKAARSDPSVQKTHWERSDLQSFSIKELKGLCKTLSHTVQDLSSELVGRLQVRDQLRTEQDAMLLEVQDLTSV